MSPELKQLWLNALKSGEYKHIRGELFKRLGPKDSDHPKCACAVGVLLLELEARPDLCSPHFPIIIDRGTDSLLRHGVPYHAFPPSILFLYLDIDPKLATNVSLNNDTADSYQYAIEYIEEKL